MSRHDIRSKSISPPRPSRRGTRANDPPGFTVHASYSRLAGLLLPEPNIVVNGRQVPGTCWGANHVPVGPGLYQVEVSIPRLLQPKGIARITVPVAAGEPVRLHYRAPVSIRHFSPPGAIGYGRQKTHYRLYGILAWIGMAELLLLVVFGVLMI
jgi:hypothetical protein